MENLDTKIAQLLKKIEEKKATIQKIDKYNWKTNCTFSYERVTTQYNSINILTVTDINILTAILSFLILQEEAWLKAATILNSKEKFTWGGFSFEDWLDDLKVRSEQICIKKANKDLDDLEKRLNNATSPEMKRKLEIESIESLLQ